MHKEKAGLVILHHVCLPRLGIVVAFMGPMLRFAIVVASVTREGGDVQHKNVSMEITSCLYLLCAMRR